MFKTSIVQCGLLYLEIRKALESTGHFNAVRNLEQYHSATPQWKQEEIAKDLLSDNGSILVTIATSALSMGFDAAGVEYIIHDTMPVHLHEFIQMTGRAGRRDGLKAYSILFTNTKQRGLNSASNSNYYRIQTQECRRAVLSRYFEGVMNPWENAANDVCCDVCGKTQDEFLIEIAVEQDEKKTTTTGPSLLLKRIVKQSTKKLIKKALLECRSSLSDSQIPFLDVELTDGVIDLLVMNANKIGSEYDITSLVPGFSQLMTKEVMDIFKEFFDLKY